MKITEFKKIIRQEIRRVLSENTSLTQVQKNKAIKALASHLAAAQHESDDDVNSVLNAQNQIKKATDIQQVVEILGDFGFEDDEIGEILVGKE